MQGERHWISEQVVTPSTHMQDIQGLLEANQVLPSECSTPSYTHPRHLGQQESGSVTWCMHFKGAQ